MNKKHIGALLTGSVILSFIVFRFFPAQSLSFFSQVVTTAIGTFSVSDFIPPEVTLELRSEQETWVILDENTVGGQTLVGQSSYSPDLPTELIQNVSFFISFEGAVPFYQSTPCLVTKVTSLVVFRVSCDQVTDSDLHLVLLPLRDLGFTSLETVLFEALLPEGVTAHIEKSSASRVYLTAAYELTATVQDASEISLTSNVGMFSQEGDTFFLDDTTIPKDELVSLEIVVTDSYGNKTVKQQEIIVVAEDALASVPVSFYPDTENTWHALIDGDSSATWFQPKYIVADTQALFRDLSGSWSDWYPVDRYLESVSFSTSNTSLQLRNFVFKSQPLIERYAK